MQDDIQAFILSHFPLCAFLVICTMGFLGICGAIVSGLVSLKKILLFLFKPFLCSRKIRKLTKKTETQAAKIRELEEGNKVLKESFDSCQKALKEAYQNNSRKYTPPSGDNFWMV